MAALIIALFLIVVVWGWFLIPKKAGAHKASTLSVRGRQARSGESEELAPSLLPLMSRLFPWPSTATGPGAPVPVVPGDSGRRASARRRQGADNSDHCGSFLPGGSPVHGFAQLVVDSCRVSMPC